MATKHRTTTYRIVKTSELTPAQLEALRAVSRERIVESLIRLIGDGRATMAQVQRKYGALMREVGHA
jgi:hypothetical protein